MSDFPHVFTPLTLRHRTLRARINFGAHTTNMAEGGLPGTATSRYYRERALGGAGMIVVEPVPVHRTAVLTRGNFRVDDDSVVPHFRRLTDACHEAGDVVMIQQLYHVGQHGDADNSFAPSWSPSGLPSYHDADGSHAMSEREIEDVIGGFVRAAVRARESGFDGVELFAAYHALIDQFWTPWSNRRTDGWGGSLAARMRFSADAARPGTGRLWRRLHRRPGRQPRPRDGAVAGRRGHAGDRGLARRAGAHGLRDLRDGELLRLLHDHADLAVPGAAGRAARGGAQGGHAARAWCRPRATSAPLRPPRRSWRPATPTWCPSSADRSPTLTWWPRPGRDGPTRCGRASRATSSAGGGAPVTTGSPA